MKRKDFRVSDEIAEKLQSDAQLHDFSEVDYFRELVEQGLVKKHKGMQKLMLDCEAQCYKCAEKLEAGDIVFYSGKVGVICKNCLDPSKNSKAFVRQDLKNIELKRTKKAYNMEIQEKREEYLTIVEKLEELSFAEKLMKMQELLEKSDSYLESFLSTSGDPYDAKEFFKEWRSCVQEIKILKKQQEAELLKHIKLPKIKKKGEKKENVYAR